MLLYYNDMYRKNFKHLLAVLIGISLLGGSGVGIAASDLQTLLISIVQTRTLAEARALLDQVPDTAGEIASGQRSSPRVWGTRFRQQPGSFQQVQVVEGRTAFVSVGRNEPDVRLLWVEGTRRRPIPNIGFSTRESRTGFSVKAELEDGKVVLQLDRYNDQQQTERTFGQMSQAVRTTITGSPGEWLDAGGSMNFPEYVPGSRTYSVTHSDDEQFRVLVRVDLVP